MAQFLKSVAVGVTVVVVANIVINQMAKRGYL